MIPMSPFPVTVALNVSLSFATEMATCSPGILGTEVAAGASCVGSGCAVTSAGSTGADVGTVVAGAAQPTSNPASTKTNQVDLIKRDIFFSFENLSFYD
jgi:hypothetical protein